ncbi:hypothetical protein HI914_04472 [Erysiphe necator]|nr:hypothetical protein HI914_04472 [Erysiphe necator]
MNSVVLVFFSLISLSLSADPIPGKRIFLVPNVDPVMCGSYQLSSNFLQKQVLEVCKDELKSSKCILSRCSLPRIFNRPTYYKGNLFPDEKAPLIVKKLQDNVYIDRNKVFSISIVVKWNAKNQICSRAGVLYNSWSGAPVELCKLVNSPFKPKSILRSGGEAKSPTKNVRFNLNESQLGSQSKAKSDVNRKNFWKFTNGK